MSYTDELIDQIAVKIVEKINTLIQIQTPQGSSTRMQLSSSDVAPTRLTSQDERTPNNDQNTPSTSGSIIPCSSTTQAPNAFTSQHRDMEDQEFSSDSDEPLNQLAKKTKPKKHPSPKTSGVSHSLHRKPVAVLK